ncbi:hypothetical protein SNEBB_005924, partial [Seison nebaliae]
MSEEELDQDLITAQELLDKSKELLVDAEQELEDQINEKTYHPSTTETNVQRELEDTNSSFIKQDAMVTTKSTNEIEITRLPPLPLPSFNGEVSNWITFWESKMKTKWVERFWNEDDISIRDILDLMEIEMQRRREIENGNPENKTSIMLTATNSNSHSISPIFHDHPSNGGHLPSTSKCFLCEAIGHTAYNCSKTIEERWKIVKEKGLCTNCLRSGHSRFVCRNYNRCKLCKGRHHTALCGTGQNNQREKGNKQQTNETGQRSIVYRTNSNLDNEIILPNAVEIPLNDKSSVCVLLDTGSSRSLVTNNSLEKLKFVKLREENLQIFGFNNEITVIDNTPIVELHLPTKNDNDRYIMEAAVVEKIGNIPFQPTNNLPNLDRHIPERSIDIIIGIDNYWKIVNINSSEKIKGTNYVKTDTVFGPMFSGSTTNKSNNCFNTQTSSDLKRCFEVNGQHKEKEDVNIDKYINWDQDSRLVAQLPFLNPNRPESNISSAIRRIISFLRSKPETIEK